MFGLLRWQRQFSFTVRCVKKGNAAIPKNSKKVVSLGEANRRQLEAERRQARFNLWTPEGHQKVAEIIGPIQQKVKDQGQIVAKSKAEKADKSEIDKEVKELKRLKLELERAEKEILLGDENFNRDQLDQVLRHRFFLVQSGEIYGGCAGFYDYGPNGTKLKNNIISQWRKIFIDGNENVLELESSLLTPKKVFEASGHLQKFSDFMVKDMKNGECFRVDVLISEMLQKKIKSKSRSEKSRVKMQEILSKLDSYSAEELGKIIKTYDIKSPLTNNKLSAPMDFNLMFECSLGPEGKNSGFLRPETAQGVYVNFSRLLAQSNNGLPFAVAQSGRAFRNEIKPANGIIRTREFHLAEIQHFYDPKKPHENLIDKNLENVVLPILSAENQLAGSGVIAKSVKNLQDENLASDLILFYLSKTFEFLTSLGIDQSKIRFREHLDFELAHYAKSCWDVECLTSHGWVECGGFAQRGCYDLEQHSSASGTSLLAQRPLDAEKKLLSCKVAPFKTQGLSKKEIKSLKTRTSEIEQILNSMSQEDLKMYQDHVPIFIGPHKINPDELIFEEKIFNSESFMPEVVEPSLGLDRIMAVVLEHNFCQREADGRKFFTFPANIAPYKASILTINSKDEFKRIGQKLISGLREKSIDFKSDLGGSVIGKKYSIMDEIGVNFSIVVDFDSVRYSPKTVTIRDRDTLNQIRVMIDEVPQVLTDLIEGKMTFNEATQKYLMQEDYLKNPEQIKRLQAMKGAYYQKKYSERDIGKLLSDLSEVAIQLENPELLHYVHNFKRAMQENMN